MKFTNPQGQSIEVNSPDGSMPTESELDQMFAMKFQTPNQIADAQINSRPSAIADLTNNPTTMNHPLGAVLRTIQGGAELMQGVPASIALDLQRVKPEDIIPNLGKVVTGQRPAQYGDVFKGAGVPAPLAAAGGLATDIALTPGGAEGMAALGKGAGKSITGVKDFFNFDQRALTLGAKVRQVASAAKQSAVDYFGSSVDAQAKANPNVAVSLENVVNDIKTNLSEMPSEAQSVFRKVPILKDMLKDPSAKGYIDPANVSLKNTQEIINYINTKIPRSIKSTSLDVLDAQNDIRAAQLDAFPQMAQTRADYGKFAEDYKLIKSALNPKSTPGAIMSNFNQNIAVKDAANRILSPVVKDMSQLRSQKNTVNLFKKIGIGAAGLDVAYEVGKKVSGR